jgi:hypothetical protein
MEVCHVIDDQARQLSACSLNCGLPVVKQPKIRSAKSSLPILLFDESHLNPVRKITQLSTNSIRKFLHISDITSLLGRAIKI